ncbi:CYTH domain-containing protein [Marinihelvus fidelis]|uniref:CYTH domain-containing protein n=1 Tax=Marinihelvus fidelis TaxID=2613842 RepID=A0A5N0TDT9_9GAMM|nr:CYTH domain-containing protein [Marinihelvus fidelis]KAA9133263.1 CYTH domain-containing protein [Marinihelvus fidelis]
MALEIERKFLLASDAWRDEVERSVPMHQGYLGGQGVSVRVRIAGDRALINIKQNRLGMAREEFEYPVPMADGLRLMKLAGGGRVEKTRHYVRRDGVLWEIDEFEGDNAGLVVAEIELDDPDQVFVHPDWLGAEVTDEERYYNVALATHPYSQWSQA